MKKMFSALLALSMVLALLPAGVFNASALQEGDYTYTVADSKATITGYSGSGANITVPSILGGYPVTGIEDYAFSLSLSMKNVTIPDSVIRIGASAFWLCTGLITVSTGNGVSSIGDHAFLGCTALTGVKIGTGMLTIENAAFSGCLNLESLTIPQGVTSIGDYAFNGCSSMARAIIPESVTSIGANTFLFCGNLTIYGYDHSYVKTYCRNEGIPFIVIYANIKQNSVVLGETQAVKVKWYGFYKTESLQLGYEAVTGNLTHAVWTSDKPKRVFVDQTGKVTNLGIGARSAKITLQMFDDYGNLLAADTVKVIFYKYNWQLKIL